MKVEEIAVAEQRINNAKALLEKIKNLRQGVSKLSDASIMGFRITNGMNTSQIVEVYEASENRDRRHKDDWTPSPVCWANNFLDMWPLVKEAVSNILLDRIRKLEEELEGI